MACTSRLQLANNGDLSLVGETQSVPYQLAYDGHSHSPTKSLKHSTPPAPRPTGEQPQRKLSVPFCTFTRDSKGVNCGNSGRSRTSNGRLKQRGFAAPLLRRYGLCGYASGRSNQGADMNQDSRGDCIASSSSSYADRNEGGERTDGPRHTASQVCEGCRETNNSALTGVSLIVKETKQGYNQQHGQTRLMGGTLPKGSVSPMDVELLEGFARDTPAVPIPSCGDAACIHGRDGILDYVDIWCELRGCREALCIKDAELDGLQRRLACLESEKTDLVSRFEADARNMRMQHEENLAAAKKHHAERYDEMLSIKLEMHEQVLKEVESLKAELERERLEHARTRRELEERERLSSFVKRQPETPQDVGGLSKAQQTGDSFMEGNCGCHLSCGEKSCVAVVGSVAVRGKVGEAFPTGATDGGNAVTYGFDERCPCSEGPPLHRGCGARLGTRMATVNASRSSSTNVTVSSLDCSAALGLDASNCPSFTDFLGADTTPTAAENLGGVVSPGLKAVVEADGCLRAVGEFSCDTQRSGATSPVNVTPVKTTVGPVLSCSRAVVEECRRYAFDLHHTYHHPFDEFVGHEGLLCKELLRAFLDKEKQFMELKSETALLPEDVRNRTNTCATAVL